MIKTEGEYDMILTVQVNRFTKITAALNFAVGLALFISFFYEMLL